MNKITCRGCGKPESECTCNVPTKDTKIEKLLARIAELEELIPTKEEAIFIAARFVPCSDKCLACRQLKAKLQAIIEGVR